MTLVIVLCHTIFNDAFRNYPDATPLKLEEQESAKFIIRYLIETRGDNSKIIAITSEQVMRELELNFPRQGIINVYNIDKEKIVFYPAQMILALKNLLFVIEGKVKNKGESVTIISDIFSSKIGNTHLISNMANKKRDIIDFYQKYESSSKKIKPEDIPFQVMTSCEIESHLREEDPSTCMIIDKRVNGEL